MESATKTKYILTNWWKIFISVALMQMYRKEYEITYVLGSFVGLADNFVALGIKPIKESEVEE